MMICGQPHVVHADDVEQLGVRLELLTSASEKGVDFAAQMVAIDSQLRDINSVAGDELRKQTLFQLGEDGSDTAREHLRGVFETEPRLRHHAAYGLSLAALRRPTSDQDWQFLVRSLTIMEGEQAVSVLRALKKFRRRATRASWVREVILMAEQLPEEARNSAYELLVHWTGHRGINGRQQDRLAAWQDWFAQTYPAEPPAMLPNDAPNARYTLSAVLELLPSRTPVDDLVADGREVFIKATCNKCHRIDDVQPQPEDDKLGPNLTTLGWRRQPREVAMAILFPSHHLNDEYPVTTVVLANGKSMSGLMMPVREGTVKIVTPDNREVEFQQTELEEAVVSPISNMPEGLLNSLTADEVRALFAFLCAQSPTYNPRRHELQ